MGWFDNIQNQKLEILKSSDGNLMTTMPEDMFNVIHMQVAVAREKLPREHLKEVINACLQVLRDVQRQSFDNLSKGWNDLDVETICATINDSHRMQAKCREFRDQVIYLIQQDDRLILEEMLDDVSTVYVNFAIKAIGFLSRLILQDLDEPVFSVLFTPEWESNSSTIGDICGTIVATLQDYFRDVEEWIPEYFYCKLCLGCLRGVIYQYCMTLKTVTTKNITFQFSNELSAARHIMTDLEALAHFFVNYESQLMNGGMSLTLDQELEPIARLARVVSLLFLSFLVDSFFSHSSHSCSCDC